jgi:hypothetical protein
LLPAVQERTSRGKLGAVRKARTKYTKRGTVICELGAAFNRLIIPLCNAFPGFGNLLRCAPEVVGDGG